MKSKLITALRIAGNAILSGTFGYHWSSNCRCNCGILTCSLLDKSPKELKELLQQELSIPKSIRDAAKEKGEDDLGSWTKMLSYNCPLTGFSSGTIMDTFKNEGLTREDIHNLEYLKDPKILSRMKKRTEISQEEQSSGLFSKLKVKSVIQELPVEYDNAEDVANYMLAWADILVEEGQQDTVSIEKCSTQLVTV